MKWLLKKKKFLCIFCSTKKLYFLSQIIFRIKIFEGATAPLKSAFVCIYMYKTEDPKAHLNLTNSNAYN